MWYDSVGKESGKVNPIGAILSAAMTLRDSLRQEQF